MVGAEARGQSAEQEVLGKKTSRGLKRLTGGDSGLSSVGREAPGDAEQGPGPEYFQPPRLPMTLLAVQAVNEDPSVAPFVTL